MSLNQEYVLTDSDLIVSKTDLKGTITYINDDFIRIGEFSKQELIGSPHNILRHPDMPKAAFFDMWKTLKAGNPWTGIVKNKTKSGGYYWVRANAMPMFENEKIVGYMSVRKKPSSTEISAAASLYRDMQLGKSNVTLDGGNIITPSFTKAIARTFENLSVKTKLVSLVTASLLSITVMASYGNYGLGIIEATSSEKMSEIAAHSKGVNLSRAIQVEFKTQVQEWKNILLRGQDVTAFTKYSKAFDSEGEEIKTLLNSIKVVMADMPEKDMILLVDTLVKDHTDLMSKYHTALKNYQTDNINSMLVVDDMVKGIDRQFIENLEKLVAFHETEIEKHLNESKALSSLIVGQFQQQVELIGLLIASVLLVWSIATLLSILRPIREATLLISKVANGGEVEVNEFSKNELGRMMQSIKMMGIKFGFEAAEDRRAATEMSRIKMALDEVTMPVTLSNSQREFIYMNKAANVLWTEMAVKIRDRIPGFTIEGMYGKSLSGFLESDEDRKSFTDTSGGIKVADLTLGGKNIQVTVISVCDERGIYIGRATQWKDVTTELAIEKQISKIVQESTTGNFRNRVKIDAREGFFKDLADGLNLLLGTCEQNYGDISKMFTALSQGDLTHSITNTYTGEFETIKNNANNTVRQLTDIVEQIKDITVTLSSSSEEVANSNNHLSKRTTAQASALEETAASMHELNSTVEANCDNANHANDFVQGASNTATKGVEVIRRVVNTMAEIHESSRKVVDIISVIDGISFQTNILALNAAVEAARAGEQGRGFAVVASEVRSLAQRAAAAAGEIKMLINDSVEKIEDGSSQVVDAGHTMEDIVGSIRTVTQMIGEINAASTEQNIGISQANEAVVNMEEMTQQNAALVEQSAVTANNLKEQAQALSEAVNYFKIR
jgi:methyl-accepting chemotaxis protein